MLLTMVGLCVSSAFASGSSASIMDLGWMAGTWSCKVWGGTFEETWLPPVGGTIQGTGRFVSGGRVEFTEFMSIENGPTDKLQFFVLNHRLSEGKAEAEPFDIEELHKDRVKFTRGGDDFPQTIIYKKTKTGMFCRIEGTQKGKPAHTDFNFVRLKTR